MDLAVWIMAADPNQGHGQGRRYDGKQKHGAVFTRCCQLSRKPLGSCRRDMPQAQGGTQNAQHCHVVQERKAYGSGQIAEHNAWSPHQQSLMTRRHHLLHTTVLDAPTLSVLPQTTSKAKVLCKKNVITQLCFKYFATQSSIGLGHAAGPALFDSWMVVRDSGK